MGESLLKIVMNSVNVRWHEFYVKLMKCFHMQEIA